MSHTILDQLSDYADWLIQEERSAATAEKYLRSLRRFALWLNDRPLCKTNVLAWRAHLQEKGYAPGTINTMLAAPSQLFSFRRDHRLQRQISARPAHPLSRQRPRPQPRRLSQTRPRCP